MARFSPVTGLIVFLVVLVFLLIIDLHSKSSTARSLKDRFSFSETSNNPSSLAKEFINSLDNPIVVYNRVPKTASTAFTHLLYDLTQENSIYVIHVNTTVPKQNAAIMSLQDKMLLRQNITTWGLTPAFYHGHFAFFDVPNVFWINLIRNPFDRLVSNYYFLRYGDNFRKGLLRSKNGDTTTFNECVEKESSKDCSIQKMWIQIPYFCGQVAACWEPGSQWALDRAKQNVLEHYFLVGTTENLSQFVEVLENEIPAIFEGSYEKFQKQDPIRKTIHKDEITEETKAKLSNTRIWRMEFDFYNFIVKNFNLIYTRSITDGKLTKKNFFYEKIYGPSGNIVK